VNSSQNATITASLNSLTQSVTLSLAAVTSNVCTVLPADNIWNTPVDQLPVSPNSSTYVNRIGARSPLHPDFGSGTYNGGPIGIPFISVSGTQIQYPVSFLYASESDPGPYATPLNAPIEGGSSSTGDRHAISIDINNCILYELYNAYPQTSSWKADSGAIFNLASNGLRTATWTSADAAGLPIFPGLVRYDEIVAGEIRHALRFTVPQTQRAYVWPARHYASSITNPTYPPMGVRFRLRADFDISGFSTTNQIILRALKKYGMMIADNGSAWFLSGAPDSSWDNTDLHRLTTITGSAFEVVDVSPLMVDPNSGQALQNRITVTVTPASASVALGVTQPFSAIVNGSSNQTVNWGVNGTRGGNSSVGFIDPNTGLYTAPNAVPNPATVTVQVTSQTTPPVTGTAMVTITGPPPPIAISISPTSTTVRISKTEQFTATLQNTTNKGVIWKINGVTGGNPTVGTISLSGLYEPTSVPSPPTVTVTAVSAADNTKSANATVTISRR
jgi:hypothetical protein